MGFQYVNNLPSPEEIKERFPLPAEYQALKIERDQAISDVLTGKSDKFLVIIGPCSADNEESVSDYVNRLVAVQEKTKDRLILIPRIYTNKPRTTGEGYKGMLHQPDPEKKPDMHEGLIAIRRMHMNVFLETGLSTADEMLYPENLGYLDDIMSYIAIGARSVENQQHRLTSSACDVAVGMKNPTSGDLSVMLNYHFEDLFLLHEMYSRRNLQNPACIVDTNHSNSSKKYKEQIRISKEILHSRKHSPEIRSLVKGLMIESYIEPGCQKVGEGFYGKSITDPCLGWEDSERLIYEIAENA